ncbi:MAG: class I SAM-dependent methyltransferase [Actinomycetota bacterium]|nr:class I SAM-dependent methyltransferase [Actinomycetota bacterium]
MRTPDPTGDDHAWERLAPWYVDHVRSGSENHRIARDLVLELAGPLDGRPAVLDVGCGEGHVARALAAAGADVTAVDASAGLLAAAAAHPSGARGRSPDYRRDDARTLATVGDGTIDGVVACLSLNDVDDLDAAVDAIDRVAAPGARAVVVIPHPCFEAPHGRWDDHGEHASPRWHRVVPDGYLRSRFWTSGLPGSVRGEAGNHHRPLGAYVDGFTSRGWACTALVEPDPKRALPPGTPNLLGLRFARG